MEQILKKEGYNVEITQDGEAGEIVGYVAVRTVITDIMAPVEEAIKKLKKGESIDKETRELIEKLKSGRV